MQQDDNQNNDDFNNRQQQKLLEVEFVEEVENYASQEIPNKLLRTEQKIARIAPVVTVDEVACFLLQKMPNQRIETEGKDQNYVQKSHSEEQRHFVPELEAEGSRQLPKAYINKVYDVSFDKSLKKNRFNEIKPSNELA